MHTKQKIIGTLIPISSLFSPRLKKRDQGTFLAGTLFLDWLRKTHQSAWQLLPLQETSLTPASLVKHVPSPYKTYGVGLDPKYISSSFSGKFPTKKEKNKFIKFNHDWIIDYAFFCALRDYFKTDDWRKWDEDLRTRKKTALNYWRVKLTKNIDNYIILQWRAHKSYSSLRSKAKSLGISLIGDLPFYVSFQSPLVWVYQDVFQIYKDGRMKYVSGILNTPSTHFGRQVWGHPLYNWKVKKNREKIISFWKMRLRYLSTIFDFIRFDHPVGFFEYGAMDPGNGENDAYKKGPGAEVFEKLIRFGKTCGLLIFAEESGEHLRKLRATLLKLKTPSIKIFRFAEEEKSGKIKMDYAKIAGYPSSTVAYTTTHDTETLIGYLEILSSEQKRKLSAISGITYTQDIEEFAKRIRSSLLLSPARIVIIPMQDWLLTKDRINVPGTERELDDPNWRYRLKIPIEKLPTSF